MAVLAIDQSTSSTSAFLVDDSGIGRIIKTIIHRQYYPAAGWVEHDAEELLRNIQSCIDIGQVPHPNHTVVTKF